MRAPLDRQLDEFTRAPVREGRRIRRIHPVRLVLTVAAFAIVTGVLAPTTDELLFHFKKSPAADIGDALALPSGALLPEDAYVRAHVVLGNHAAEIPLWRPGSLRFGPIIVRQVLGAPLWIEHDKAKHPTWGPFVAADVEGRVVSFAADSELSEARRLIEQQGIEIPADARVIIVDEQPGKMGNYVTAWITGFALVIWTLLGLWKSARPRVVVDDEAARA